MLDCLIIGAGFGGLGAALTLAEAGAKVALCEALNYPGGCASTFTRAGHSFESGATLSSGFDEGQLFARWIARHRLEVRTVQLDPIVELRAPGLALLIPASRDALIERLCALPGAPAPRVRKFFARQRSVADALWPLLDSPELLPPFTPRALVRHASRLARYAQLLPLLGRPLLRVLEEEGVADFRPLRTLVDSVCQITVQAPAAEAEAPLALSALDYFFRGTRHVHGGIGALASALASAIGKLGGEVRFADAVKSLAALPGGGFRAQSRRGAIDARAVIANVLPQDLRALCEGPLPSPRLDALSARLEDGWGAVMLYRALPSERFSPAAQHLELVAAPRLPLTEGNHLFCSLSAADEKQGPAGVRSLTVSTHLAMKPFLQLGAGAQGEAIARVQARMRETLRALAPELGGETLELTASPRTFQRFTRRRAGLVGGVPRRAGLHNYRQLAPVEVARGLFLVGDSVFPGQSTLAAAIGGARVAAQLLARPG